MAKTKVLDRINEYSVMKSAAFGGISGMFGLAVYNDFFSSVDAIRRFFMSFYNFPLWADLNLPVPVPDPFQMLGSFTTLIGNAFEGGIAPFAVVVGLGAVIKGGLALRGEQKPGLRRAFSRAMTLPFKVYELPFRIATAALGALAAVIFVNQENSGNFIKYVGNLFSDEVGMAFAGGLILGGVLPNMLFKVLSAPFVLFPDAVRLGTLLAFNWKHNSKAFVSNAWNKTIKEGGQLLGSLTYVASITGLMSVAIAHSLTQGEIINDMGELMVDTNIFSGPFDTLMDLAVSGLNHISEAFKILIHPFASGYLGPKVIGEGASASVMLDMAFKSAGAAFVGWGVSRTFNKHILKTDRLDNIKFKRMVYNGAPRPI